MTLKGMRGVRGFTVKKIWYKRTFFPANNVAVIFRKTSPI